MKTRYLGSAAKLRNVFLVATLGLFGPIATLFIAAPHAFAAGTTWNITAANFNNNTGCVIQDAIIANNTGSTSGGCAAGTGGTGTINLGPGTYNLGADLIKSTSPSPINIVGAGVGVTIIDGGGDSQGNGGLKGFYGSVNISNLTMQHIGMNVNEICPHYFAICTTGSLDNVVVKNSQGGIGSLNSDSISNVAAINNRYAGLGFFDFTVQPSDGATNVSNAVSYGNSIGVVVSGSAQPNNIIATNLTIANNSNDDDSQAAGISYSPGNLHLSLQNSSVANNVTASVSANCSSSKPNSSGDNESSDGTCSFSAAGDKNNVVLHVGTPTQNGSGMYVVAVTTPSTPSTKSASKSSSDSGSSSGSPSKASTPASKTTDAPTTQQATTAQSKSSASKSIVGEYTHAKSTRAASASPTSHNTAVVVTSSAVAVIAVIVVSWWAFAARPSFRTKFLHRIAKKPTKQKKPRKS